MISSALAVAEASEQTAARRARVKVLDEDKYVASVETIIGRDFFPDVEKLRAQKEYLEAEELGDLQLMRHIALKYTQQRQQQQQQQGAARETRGDTDRQPPVTPASFETPEPGSRTCCTPRGSAGGAGTGEGAGGGGGEVDAVVELPGLDRFLVRHTSEDNASFGSIMDIAAERNRVKHAWLLEAETHHKEKRELALQLPSVETQALESSQAGLETWEYSAKNSLMYYPEAISVQDSDTQPAREIAHRNTRLHGNPYSRALNRNSLQQAAAYQAQFRLGKIGVDGREITQESPQVNGFGYVGTPSPAPGMSESPLVTWGEVEGTPFRLDGPDTPHLDRTPAPAFKMPGPTRRETLGHRMANEASIKHRTRKQEAIRRVTESFVSPSPRPFGGALSPALQKLVQKTTAGSAPFADATLRASYTPTPSPGGGASTGRGVASTGRGGASARSGGGASARSGGGASARSGGGGASPGHVGGAATAASERKVGSSSSSRSSSRRVTTPGSITDNLLSLPSRKRAADFF